MMMNDIYLVIQWEIDEITKYFNSHHILFSFLFRFEIHKMLLFLSLFLSISSQFHITTWMKSNDPLWFKFNLQK